MAMVPIRCKLCKVNIEEDYDINKCDVCKQMICDACMVACCDCDQVLCLRCDSLDNICNC